MKRDFKKCYVFSIPSLRYDVKFFLSKENAFPLLPYLRLRPFQQIGGNGTKAYSPDFRHDCRPPFFEGKNIFRKG